MKITVLIPFVFYAAIGLGQQPAFPGAEGFGACSEGGRGGIVCFVDNLNDSGAGSFREAVQTEGPRTIIFRISGTIELKSPLEIINPFLTVAGQTAPGDGICLKNYPLKIKNSHDIVIRNIRVRPGTDRLSQGSSSDAIEVRSSKRVIIDHCSFSWGTDELLNTWHGTSDITVQWCILSEPLNKSTHKKGEHGYAASIGGTRASYHYNLLANAPARNPSIAGQDKDKTIALNFCNNVVYNWGFRSCDGKPMSINFTGNYYKPGPATIRSVKRRLVRIDNCDKYGFTAKWHIENNCIEGFHDLSENNWEGAVDFERGTSPENNRNETPFSFGGFEIETPQIAYNEVLKNAGAISPKRDKTDKRIISEVKSGRSTFGNGIIDKVRQTDGWPELKSTKAPKDSDSDGMPDMWENKNQLNSLDPADRNFVSKKNGYTNLENYLNELLIK